MGLQGRIVRRLPIGIQAYPLDATFAFLGMLSGTLTLLGLTSSRALAETLPSWAVLLWAVMLIVGSVTWGVGILSARTNGNNAVVITRAPVMVFGLALVSTTAFVFAVGIITVAGLQGVLASVPLLAYSAGTYLHRLRILERLKDD